MQLIRGGEIVKHMISNKGVCPYYKHEDSQVIYCEGVKEGSVIHLAFSNKTDAREYKIKHCRCDYNHCKINTMLDGMNK